MILDDILSNYAQRLVAGQGRDMMAAEGMRYNRGGYYRDVYEDMNEPDQQYYDYTPKMSYGMDDKARQRSQKDRFREELKSPSISSSTFMYNKPLDVKQTIKDRDKGSFVAEGQSPGPKQGQFIAPSTRPFASGSGSGGGYSSGASAGDGTRGGGFYYEDESFNSYLTDIYNMNANADMVMERGGKYTYVDGGKF